MYIRRILLAIVLIGILVAGIFAYYVYNTMLSPNTNFEDDKVIVTIPTGATFEDVRDIVKAYVKDIESFETLAYRKKYSDNIKSGRFAIKKDMSNNDIINSIRSENLPIKLSFNNQHSLEALAGRIAKQIEADSLSLLNAFKDEEFLKDNNFNDATALGMYVPNSYEFFWNTSAETFRERMLKEYKRFWNSDRLQKAKDIGLNPSEVIALASIVQEETKQKVEQPVVAGVYMNRLKNKWPLDADPTIKFAAYQLPKYKNTIIRRVLNVHKEINSPYNTYKNQGLPPGLIAMPDVSAIDAVLNYKKHDYFFFVVDVKKPGFHKFSKSISQHNAYAREYHNYLNKRGIKK